MQILFGVDETIVKINSKSISIDYIQHFISTHFTTRKIKDNFILIPASSTNTSHRIFLLKWLYSLYAKKNEALPELKEYLLKRQHKAIKIITTKKIVYRLLYKIIDENNIHIQINPQNNNIVHKLKIFLQTKITITPTYLQVTLKSPEEKELLAKFINSTDIINVVHQHIYNKKKMKDFLHNHTKSQEKDLTSIQEAYLILGSSKDDDIKTIKKRYKSLAKEFHPDKVHGRNEEILNKYTKKFQAIFGAYETIFKTYQ